MTNLSFKEFDLPNEKIRVPEARKHKILILLDELLDDLGKSFSFFFRIQSQHIPLIKPYLILLKITSLSTAWKDSAGN